MINRASKEASKSTFKFQLGAVVVKGGRVISVGHNSLRFKSSNRHTRHEQSLHAEVDALLKAGNKTKGSTLFVSRLARNGQPALARPCAWCMSLMKELGVKKVIYTLDSNTTVMEKL